MSLVVCSFLLASFGAGISNRHFYLGADPPGGFSIFFINMHQLLRLVPLEVILFTDLSCFLYSLFIKSDVQMMNVSEDKKTLDQCKVHSSHIISQLGSVKHVLIDKTGTLTKNQLSLRAICTGAVECKSDKLFNLL